MEDQILTHNFFKIGVFCKNNKDANSFLNFPQKNLKLILSIMNNKWALIIYYP